MSLFLVGSGNSPLQPIADFLHGAFRQDVSISYAPQMALAQLQTPGFALPAVMIADISGQSVSGATSFLHAVQFAFPDMPVVTLANPEQTEQSDLLLQAGCMDVLPKPVSRPRLRIAVLNALRMRSLQQEVHRMRLREREEHPAGLGHIHTHNAQMQLALVLARKAAEQCQSIWLQGEHGTGKETLARAMFAESERSGIFVAINCGGTAENILERQLFGGASRRMQGAFEKSRGGMLYLDGIEHMPTRFLTMLAEALTDAPDHWLAVSTCLGMADMVMHKELYHLLSETCAFVPLALPPLHQRTEDLADLARAQLARFAGMEGRLTPELSDGAIAWLKSRPWADNLPEFSRALHRALWMADAARIEVAHLEGRWPMPMRDAGQIAPRRVGEGYLPVLTEEGKLRSLADLEEEMLQIALKHHEGCMSRTARSLGIGRSTLYRKLQERGVATTA